MKRLLRLGLFIPLLLHGGLAGAENIVVSLVTPSAAYMDHFVSVEKGYFREQNLSVEYVQPAVASPYRRCCPAICT